MTLALLVASALVAAPPMDPALFVVDTAQNRIMNVQHCPAAALSRHNYLIVWQDSIGGDICGRRFDLQGSSLDQRRIIISAAPRAEQNPLVAAVGDTFLVIWRSVTYADYGLFACRVSAEGQVLDPSGIRISTTPAAPALAASDSGWLVVWMTEGSSPDIRAARVARDGQVLDPGGNLVAGDDNEQRDPVAGSCGGGYFVAWQSRTSGWPVVRGTRLTASGRVLDPGGIFLAGDASLNIPAAAAAVASDGNDCLVAWQNTRANTVNGILVSGTSGMPGRSFALSPLRHNQERDPDLAFNGRDYVAVWTDSRSGASHVWGTRVSRQGTVIDSAGRSLTGPLSRQTSPGLAARAGSALLVWVDETLSSSGPTICAATLDSALNPGPSFVAGVGVRDLGQLNPVVAALGAGYFAVWSEESPLDASPWHLSTFRGAHIASDGTVSGCRNVFSVGGHIASFAVARSDTVLLVIVGADDFWDRGIHARRLCGPDARPDPTGPTISVADGASLPKAAAGDSTFLVVWTRALQHPNHEIRGARLSQSGVILDPGGIVIRDSASSPSDPAVGFDGTNWLVVWRQQQSAYRYAVYGARVNQQGQIIDTGGFRITRDESQWIGGIDLAFDGANYLVVWSDWGDWIMGTRVSPAAQLLDSADLWLTRYPRGADYPSIVFDGSQYVMTCEGDYDDPGLRTLLITPGGVVTDTIRIPSRDRWYLKSPDLARGPDDRILMVCSGPVAGFGGQDSVRRVLGSLLTPYAITEPGPTARQGPALTVFPSPFTTSTRISLARSPASRNLVIRDVCGRVQRRLSPAGQNSVVWDGCDDRQRRLPAGRYFIEPDPPGKFRPFAVTRLE